MPGLAGLAGAGVELRPRPGRRIGRADLVDADALLVRSVTPVDARLLAHTAVRFVGSATAGTDHVDIAALRALGVTFAHAAGANANAVVEYVLAVIAVCGDKLQRLFAGGRVGIVGYGNVGRQLAGRLHALGLAWCAYDPWLDPAALRRPGRLEDVCACDVITLHPSLTDAAPYPSRHLFGQRELASTRAGALIINASRGPVLDGAALGAWLAAGLGRAALDVWETEPEVPEALAAAVDIATPHIAGYSLDARLRGTRRVLEALDRTLGTALARHLGPPRRAALTLPAAGTAADRLRTLLLRVYDPRRDDARLRAALAAAGSERAAAFDRLRLTYGERRELAGAMVTGGDAHSRQLARSLGCVFERE